ncbi:unnamed protein product, partial [Chrysoparadoxa australica]
AIQEGGWAGADTIKSLLQALQEAPATERAKYSTPMCSLVMRQIQQLTQDQLKRESTEEMGYVVRELRRLVSSSVGPTGALTKDTAGDMRVFTFWLGLTQQYMSASSLPLRLFGWEQVAELIDVARAAKPPHSAYKVEGAGVEVVNGVYEIAQGMQGGAHKYEKRSGEGDNELLLTLFRCQMRSKSKWWFISEADKAMPGTEKDIDYYQHRSQHHEEAAPSRTGWTTCTGKPSAGQDPPPYLTPLGLHVEPGMEKETLEHRLCDWVVQDK